MNTMRRQLEFRPLDFIYDPVYITTDKADYTANASYGLSCVSQYAIQPQYDAMFTDNEKYSRNLVVFRSTILPQHVNVSWSAKKHRMMQDRRPGPQDRNAACRYFARPNVAELNPFVNSIHLTSPTKPDTTEDHEHQEEVTHVKPAAGHKRNKMSKKVRKAVQTDYRESEAQTYPWAPPKPRGLEKMPPEIVTTLDFEHWQRGYPVTQNELDMIERTRLRRACERALNSDTVDLSSKHHLIKQIEIYEWVQREDEINRVYKLREKLSRKQTHMFTYLNQMRMDKRLNEVTKRKTKEMEKKLSQIEKRRDRELRKLVAKTNAVQISDIMEISKSKVIVNSCNSKEKRDMNSMTPLQRRKMLRQLDPDDLLEPQDIEEWNKSKPRSLCPIEKKWKSHNIEKMYEGLMAQWKSHLNVKKRIKFPQERMETPSDRSRDSDQLDPIEDEAYRNSVLLQKMTRGQRWQHQVQEGMVKAKPLMEEVKETLVLTEEDVRDLEDRIHINVEKKRTEDAEMRQRRSLDSVQGQLQGEAISSVLDFLSKELARLEDERRCHALSLLAETQRDLREAKESGRRQRVAERRREFNEMFKQIVKIKQDTVDSYLESILLDSLQSIAQDRAREFIVEKAKAIDLQAQEEMQDKLAEEALVQDLMYNCTIPEVVNIQTRVEEEDAKRRGERGIVDLLQATDLEPTEIEAENRESAEKEERQREVLDLQEQLMNILFPMRYAPGGVCPGMPREAMSGVICVKEELESSEEFDELSTDVSNIAASIGKELFEILLQTAHRVYETVTNQIIEEIIRTLLSKPGALDHPSRSTISGDSWSPSDFRMDLFKDDFFGSTLSFTEDRQEIQDLLAKEDENTSYKIIESDSNSEISQEFNADRQ